MTDLWNLHAWKPLRCSSPTIRRAEGGRGDSENGSMRKFKASEPVAQVQFQVRLSRSQVQAELINNRPCCRTLCNNLMELVSEI